MLSLASLWLPILLSALLVFAASAAIHMFLGYHQGDFGPLPDEGSIRAALRAAGVSPGEYVVPHAHDREAIASEQHARKLEEGPVAFLTVLESGPWPMGRRFTQWFVYCLVVGVFAGYVTSRAVGPGAEYLSVFRFVGTTAFLGYVLGLWQDSIWYGRKWSTTLKNTLDGLVYALLTAGTFGWLWPG